ncbi:hypothetical protein OH77DRAFT_814069 [Trametes cingulata]|nr:hypothetical protein OH77DRAFT_814069 [Trametes cingulata]
MTGQHLPVHQLVPATASSGRPRNQNPREASTGRPSGLVNLSTSLQDERRRAIIDALVFDKLAETMLGGSLTSQPHSRKRSYTAAYGTGAAQQDNRPRKNRASGPQRGGRKTRGNVPSQAAAAAPLPAGPPVGLQPLAPEGTGVPGAPAVVAPQVPAVAGPSREDIISGRVAPSSSRDIEMLSAFEDSIIQAIFTGASIPDDTPNPTASSGTSAPLVTDQSNEAIPLRSEPP